MLGATEDHPMIMLYWKMLDPYFLLSHNHSLQDAGTHWPLKSPAALGSQVMLVSNVFDPARLLRRSLIFNASGSYRWMDNGQMELYQEFKHLVMQEKEHYVSTNAWARLYYK